MGEIIFISERKTKVASDKNPTPRPAVSSLTAVVAMTLFLWGAMFFLLAMGFMLYQANGKQFLPISPELIPFPEWSLDAQSFFMRLILLSCGLIGITAGIGLIKLLQFAGWAIRKRCRQEAIRFQVWNDNRRFWKAARQGRLPHSIFG